MLRRARSTGARIAWAVALACGLVAPSARAQQPKSAQQTVDKQVDPVREDKAAGDWIALPVLYYSPETLLAGGAVGIYYFRLPGSDKETRASNIKGDFIYTMRQQFLAQMSPQFYFDDEKYFLDTDFSYVRFFDRYWGVGNNTPDSAQEEYTSDTIRGRVGLLRRLPPYANFGPRLHVEEFTLREFERGKLIDTDPTVIGARESLITGFGVEFQYDSRDNYFSATTGSYVSAQALVFTRTLGGTATYLRYTLDARRFFPTWRGQVLAIQGYFNAVTSGVPFTSLAQLGGINLSRGIFDGRYRDLLAAVVQAEYRVPIYWRFGVVGFAALGEVSSSLTGFTFKGIHPSGGGGVRFLLKEDERIFLRADVGFGSAASFYFTANEAF
ncbi:MAG: BamA/TamA family outer membrane protein [Myxococcales bacterium]|nr:BamA/TamA family outer membrane protein [Myxococcales bacterium]